MAAGQENRWISTSSTDYSVGANWSLGTIPVDDENLIVGSEATADILDNMPSDAAAVAVRSFHRHKDSTINIGTTDAPLVMATQAIPATVNSLDPTGKVIVQGPGKFFYINGVGGAAQSTALMYIDTDTQNTAIEVNGAIANLTVIKGRVTGLSSLNNVQLHVTYRTNPATDAHVTLQTTNNLAQINQHGGEVVNTSSTSVDFLRITSGVFDHGENAGAMTQLLMGGGVVKHRANTDVFLAHLLGGTLDMSLDPRAKIVSELYIFPGAVFKPNAHITITEGGSILPITDIAPQSF